MLACTVYVSEGANVKLLKTLEQLVSGRNGVALVNKFTDTPYNRSSFTLASAGVGEAAVAAAELAKAAICALDLRTHEASHPRLGVVDHISCHPLTAAAAMEDAAALARSIGSIVSAEPTPAPVFLYGAAHPEGRRLADLRRSFGYFEGSAGSSWSGAIDDRHLLTPDLGPVAVSPRTGIVAVGASKWITNYNILLNTADLVTGRKIAREVSERGGGLPHVQAMALRHAEGAVEVACNLLDHEATPPPAVLERVRSLAAAHGIEVSGDYQIAGDPAELVRRAEMHLSGTKPPEA